MDARGGVRGAGVAAMILVATTGAHAEALADPVRITLDRIVVLAGAFVDGPVAQHLEHATSGRTEEEIAAIVGSWHERSSCEVPDERAPLGAIEVESWVGAEELGGARVRDLLEDGWGRPIQVWFELAELARPRLVLRSAGPNGRFEGSAYRVSADGSTSGSDDFVWRFDGFCWAPAAGIGEGEPAPVLSPDRAAQERTLGDLRELGMALLLWQMNAQSAEEDPPGAVAARGDEGIGPCEGPPPRITGDDPDLDGLDEQGRPVLPPGPRRYRVPPAQHRIERAELERLLRREGAPGSERRVPEFDGWNRPLELYVDRAHPTAERVSMVRSAGSDGRFDTDCYTVGPFDPDDAGQDIVWADGVFLRWPGRAGEPPGGALREP